MCFHISRDGRGSAQTLVTGQDSAEADAVLILSLPSLHSSTQGPSWKSVDENWGGSPKSKVSSCHLADTFNCQSTMMAPLCTSSGREPCLNYSPSVCCDSSYLVFPGDKCFVVGVSKLQQLNVSNVSSEELGRKVCLHWRQWQSYCCATRV
jgi:hypothetical protein